MLTEPRDGIQLPRKDEGSVGGVQKLQVLQNRGLCALSCAMLTDELNQTLIIIMIQVTSIRCLDFGMGLFSSYFLMALDFLARSGVQPECTRSGQRSWAAVIMRDCNATFVLMMLKFYMASCRLSASLSSAAVSPPFSS